MTKINFYIEPELRKKLKKYCIDNETNITKVLVDCIKDLVKNYKEND